MISVEVSIEEARALQRFRTNPESQHIFNVISRELGVTREMFENEPVSEEKRLVINAYKAALRVLFDYPLTKAV